MNYAYSYFLEVYKEHQQIKRQMNRKKKSYDLYIDSCYDGARMLIEFKRDKEDEQRRFKLKRYYMKQLKEEYRLIKMQAKAKKLNDMRYYL